MRSRMMRRSVSISRSPAPPRRARTAALPLEVGPQARQPRQHVFVVGQLHLRLGVGRLGPRHEDVEDQARAVQDAARHRLLDVARLRRRELVVEDRHVDLLVTTPGGNLLQLARPHVDAGRGLRQPLHEPPDGPDIGRLGQKLQLVEVLLGLTHRLPIAHDGDQHGPLAGGGRAVGRSGMSVLFLFQIESFLGLRSRRRRRPARHLHPGTSPRCKSDAEYG